MKLKSDAPLTITFGPNGSCGCGTLSRRRFLSRCATCAAGAMGLAGIAPGLSAAEPERKLRIRTLFSHATPETITWPNIGYNFDKRAQEVLAQLTPLCPGIEFVPAHTVKTEDAMRVLTKDKEVDGYLIYMLGMQGNVSTVLERAGKEGRPIVVVEDQYGGPFSLGFNAKAEKSGWKALALATTRLSDIAEVINCFNVLQKPGATADQFLVQAKATFRKNLGPKGTMDCTKDEVSLKPISQVLEKLRNATILLVGYDLGPGAKQIEEVFGTKVVAIKHAELHEAWTKAEPASAEKWAAQWMQAAAKIVEPTREELIKSGAMLVAMQELMKKYQAQAITINCLGGFYGGHLKAYPCLGFTELNNSGLVGACEGDLQSTITMLAMGYLTERPGFISDPVIDTSKNRIIYAHCVAPTKVFGARGPSCPYDIRSHSEDRRGAALRAFLPDQYMVTTLKLIPGSRQAVLHLARTVDNIDEDKACRTKLAAEVNGDIEKLFSNWAHGWHRVTYYGDLKEPVKELCKALDIKLKEEA